MRNQPIQNNLQKFLFKQPSKLKIFMKKIILRLDLNVPIKKERNADKILDTTRIDLVLNEIKKLSNKKKVVVLSHLGSGEPSDSLSVVEKYIRRKLNKKENENLFICENTR